MKNIMLHQKIWTDIKRVFVPTPSPLTAPNEQGRKTKPERKEPTTTTTTTTTTTMTASTTAGYTTRVTASTIIPDRLLRNPSYFVFLDLLVDEDFDSSSFMDLVSSFRYNYTIQYITLIRSREEPQKKVPESSTSEHTLSCSKDEDGASSTDGKQQARRRTTQEIRTLLMEILNLPRLKNVGFENFADEELDEFVDLMRSSCKRPQ